MTGPHAHHWNGPWLATRNGAVESCSVCAAPKPIERPTWERVAKGFGVPRRAVEARLDSEPRTAALDAVRDYRPENEGTCLVLTGPTGVGKTWAAVASLRLSYEEELTDLRFVYFPALCGRLLMPETRHDALESAKSTYFVVLDDLGTEYVKEGGLVDAFLDEIIWHREAEELPTIITTNLTAQGLKTRLPERLVDRLRGSWGHIFECPGPSQR